MCTALVVAVALVALSLPTRANASAAPRVYLSEIMVNPVVVDDEHGEWLELYSAEATPVSVDGLALRIGEYGSLPLGELGLWSLAPGEYVVIGAARTFTPTFGGPSGGPGEGGSDGYGDGVPELDGFFDFGRVFANDGDIVQLLWHDEVIDQLRYGDGGPHAPAGVALNREPFWREPSWGTGAEGEATAEWCEARADEYGERYGTPGEPNTWCDSDADGFAEDQGDCDDGDLAIAPDAQETCNGRDDDCDGQVDEPDAALSTPIACLADGVCDGVTPTCVGAVGWRCHYPEGYEQEESLCDGLDNDCDGTTDEGLLNACGRCGSLPADRCDGTDEDCDGETDEDASVDQGAVVCLTEGECRGTAKRCGGADGWLCQYPPTVEHGEERSCDGLDNDCDGDTDEPFAVGAVCEVGAGECRVEGTTVCAADGAGSRCDAVAAPAGAEHCGDGRDNDCDGATDEGFDLGADCEVGRGACRAHGKLVCSADGLAAECSARAGDPATERCADGVDNDCDGETDEPACMAAAPDVESGGACDAAPRRSPPTGPYRALALAGLVALLLLQRTRRAGGTRRERFPMDSARQSG